MGGRMQKLTTVNILLQKQCEHLRKTYDLLSKDFVQVENESTKKEISLNKFLAVENNFKENVKELEVAVENEVKHLNKQITKQNIEEEEKDILLRNQFSDKIQQNKVEIKILKSIEEKDEELMKAKKKKKKKKKKSTLR